MNTFKLGVAVASSFGVLMLAAMNRPAFTTPSVASVVQPAPPLTTAQTQTQPWRYQIAASTLDQYLNVWAAGEGTVQTPLGTARLRQLHTDIRDNELIMRGTADTGWLSVPVDATVTASVQSGQVQVRIVEAHIKGVDVPDGPRAQIEYQLQSQMTQALAAYHVSVRSVQLANGEIVVTGTRL